MMSNQHCCTTARAIFQSLFVLSAAAMMFVCFGNAPCTPGRLAESLPSNPSNLGARNSTGALGDGCWHVFLDVGANIGVHGRFLLEPEKYPDAKVAQDIFNQQFGEKRDNRDICVFEVEANPRQWPKIEAKAEAYAKMGWRYHLIRGAASDHDGTLEFWHNQDEQHEEWAFGAKKFGADGVKAQVPAIRWSTWVLNEIGRRHIPTRAHGIHAGAPKVVMKLDIEGSEYLVLPDMIASGALCQHIDFVFGEDHATFAPLTFNEVKSRTARD